MITPTVTVLVPARDEADDIERCLRHIVGQDYPAGRLEVVLIDGDSHDGTADRARGILARAGLRRWTVVHNPAATTPSNLNVGLSVAEGDIVCRVDARSLIGEQHVRICAEVLAQRPDVVVVGGSQIAVPPSGGALAQGIARALNNRYGMGLSRYRRGARSGPADTVYLGAFRTEHLRREGGWDERMLSNQDFDLNRRLGRHGIVWYDDRLDVGYVPRRDLGELLRQYHRFGRWKVRYWRETGERPVPRQWLLLVSPAVVVVGAAWGRRSRLRRRALVVGAVASAVIVEMKGADRPADVEPAAHAVAVAGLATVAVGWLSGVARELVAAAVGGGR